MMDWERTKKELEKEINPDSVSEREGSRGMRLSYIEGWWAMAEANRIFGFDGWHRETIEIRQITEKPVGYMAKVRITVAGVVREGCGWGSMGDHEKCIKEAETDATKRALVTFGRPFGLSLYDKEKEWANAPATSTAISPKEFAGQGSGTSAAASKPAWKLLEDSLKKIETTKEVGDWWKNNKKEIWKSLDNEAFWRFYMKVLERGTDKAKNKLEFELFWSTQEGGLKELEKASFENHREMNLYMLTKADKLQGKTTFEEMLDDGLPEHLR